LCKYYLRGRAGAPAGERAGEERGFTVRGFIYPPEHGESMNANSQDWLSPSERAVVEEIAREAEGVQGKYLFHYTHKLTIEPFTARHYPYVSFQILIDGRDFAYVPIPIAELTNIEYVRNEVINGVISAILDYLYH